MSLNMFGQCKNSWVLGLSRWLSGYKDSCCQVWQPEFDPQDPHGERRQLNPTFCSLILFVCQGECVCMLAHIRTHNKRIKLKVAKLFSYWAPWWENIELSDFPIWKHPYIAWRVIMKLPNACHIFSIVSFISWVMLGIHPQSVDVFTNHCHDVVIFDLWQYFF